MLLENCENTFITTITSFLTSYLDLIYKQKVSYAILYVFSSCNTEDIQD